MASGVPSPSSQRDALESRPEPESLAVAENDTCSPVRATVLDAAIARVGPCRSSTTVSHCAFEWFAWLAWPVWLALFGLSGTEASDAIAQTVTGPSWSCDASTLQLNVVFLPALAGDAARGRVPESALAGVRSRCTHTKFAGNGPAAVSSKPIETGIDPCLANAAPPAATTDAVGLVRSIVVYERLPCIVPIEQEFGPIREVEAVVRERVLALDADPVLAALDERRHAAPVGPARSTRRRGRG